jgi:hypothetical protein
MADACHLCVPEEHVPEESLVQIEAAGYSATICENCLTILIVHHRYHNLNLGKLIFQISANRDRRAWNRNQVPIETAMEI